MAHGAPDWTDQVQVVIVKGQPADEAAAGDIGNYSGSDTTYQPLATWTVDPEKTGELKEILIISDDYAHTLVKITIDDEVFETDWSPTSAMPIIFEDLRLAGSAVVKLEAKSSEVIAIDVDAIIVGKEVG